jgi:hypothetical protein
MIHPINALDALKSIRDHLAVVVRYGKDTTNALDFEHISTALDEIELPIKAQVA